MTAPKPFLKYPGAKWRAASWIIEHIPRTYGYMEPFAGSGAVFFSLPWMPEHAVLNDMSGEIINLFVQMRTNLDALCNQVELTPYSRAEQKASLEPTEDQLERARRFLCRCWMSHGVRLRHGNGFKRKGQQLSDSPTYTIWNRVPERLRAVAERLKAAEIESQPALEFIALNNNERATLYVDPPYPLATRNNRKIYHVEMNNADHLQLLEVLREHKGPVILSSYANELYQLTLGWQTVEHKFATSKGSRDEVLYLNEHALDLLRPQPAANQTAMF